jgi:uncharacterized membrane protein
MDENIAVGSAMAFHIFAGVGALTLGVVQVFFMPRGTKEHKKIGWIWAVLMLILAMTSLYDLIGDGWLSLPAHVFTVATFVLLPVAVWSARNKKIALHKYSMILLFSISILAFAALIAAPGRLFNVWFFGGG